MSQWDFKLFEFDIKDEFDSSAEFVKGKDNKQFIVQMFGIDTEGKTACIFARGYQPFFYVKVGDDWTNTEMTEFVAELKKRLGDYYGESITKSKLVKRQKLYGFDNKKLHTFIQLKFQNMPALNKTKNLWYKDTNIGGKFERKMRPEGILFHDVNTELYEAQIPPLLRLFHIREISPSGWIAMTPGTYTLHKKKTTTCDYEFSINYRQIKPIHQKETRVPYKILSFDIEASSSHGDFPLAKKNYKRLAMNIYELTRHITIAEITSEWVKRCIDTAFSKDDSLRHANGSLQHANGSHRHIKGIEKIYPKHKTTQIEIDEKFAEWIIVCPAAYNVMIQDEFINKLEQDEKAKQQAEDDEGSSDEELEEGPIEIVVESGFRPIVKRIKKYTKKEATVLDLLRDADCERDTKIQELTKTLDLYFPEIEGDRVTFIGSSLRLDGQAKPYLKHCIVVDTCNPVEGAVIVSVSTEAEALVAWTEFVQKENPDIIIGYNIHGWDCNFMFERSQELGCTTKFLMLSRNNNEVCINKDWKTGKMGIEQNSLFIASGQFDIKYFKMAGRLQIDFLNLFRREHQLSSYKLDYVAGYFIGDTITKVLTTQDLSGENINTIIYSKNLTGLDVGDYIVIEEIGHTTNMYNNGQKFIIKHKFDDRFELEGNITPDTTKSLRWSLGKDDVTPQDIFRMTNQGPAERAVVAKYCIKDTTLVQDLMRKVDTITGFIEMSKICSVPMSFLVMRGQGIKLTSFVAKKCREKNTLMPVIEKSLDDEGYEGAIVLPPKCNLYLDDPVACVDYSSLYPSSIISENLSHDSKVWTKEYDLVGNLLQDWGVKRDTTQDNSASLIENLFIYDNLPGYKYVDVTYDTFRWTRKTPKGAAVKERFGYKICRFIQFNEGKAILPSILEELLAARKATRALMKHEKDPFMVNIYDNRQLAIKVTANSLYGQCGAKTSTFFEKDVAASTTAIGRKLLIYAKTVIETAYDNTTEATKNHGNVKVKGEYIYGDSVASYTPVYVRVNKIVLDICTIQELAIRYGDNQWKSMDEKEACELTNIESWTEKGWTACHRVIRHTLNACKNMVRVLTHTGLVDVTDDHSLVTRTGAPISSQDVEIGTPLLHHTVIFNPIDIEIISVEKAMILGSLFAVNDTSVIPFSVLNGSNKIRKAFWNRFTYGKDQKTIIIDQKLQIGAAQICWLANSLGYTTNIYNINVGTNNIYRIFATREKKEKDKDEKDEIKHLEELTVAHISNETTNGFIYDLTTENHHFAAGIGNMIVHNTDSVFFTFNLRDENDNKIIGKKSLEITIELAQKAGALATKFLKQPHDLEYEKTFMPFCLLSKKRYVGMLYEFDANKCKRKSMGIVLKRRDNAPIVKDIYGGVIDILMNEKKVLKAVDYVKECLQNVVDERYPREKLIITKSLRSNYKNPGQIAHNVLANRIGEREPGNKPGPGDRIPFIYIKNADKKALQGEKIENPKYILENSLKIDYGFYITNQIMKPLQQVFALVLEQMPDFKTVRGKTSRSWKSDIEKLHVKWPTEEKYNKKYEEFRCKEVKTILFDPYIKLLK